MAMKEKLKDLLVWCVLAFLLGMSIDAGRKVMTYFWPDKQSIVIHKIEND